MNDFKKPAYTPTRIKRLEQEIETLQQARDRAIEAAAKNRLVAELALTALLPGFDVSHCDAADLEAIQDFLTATDHLKEMSDAEPLKLIRSLQMQINRLTEQYGSEFEGEQAQELEALNFLRKLSQRQERIQDATYDLSISKNK